MQAPPTVPAEVQLDEDLVTRLVATQHPDLTGPVRAFSEGWDNRLFRVSEAFLARMPRRQIGADNLVRERRALPRLPPLELQVPFHLRDGAPADSYPYPWAITAFLKGAPPGSDPIEPGPTAAALRRVFDQLHREGSGAPLEAARSSLERRDADVRRRIAELDRPELYPLWDAGREADAWGGPPVWVHGDLHAFNLLACGGRLTAVLDWGDVFLGDPAPDLVAAWMLLDPEWHGPVRAGVDAATWARGTAWAVYFGVMFCIAARCGGPAPFGVVGERTLARLVSLGP